MSEWINCRGDVLTLPEEVAGYNKLNENHRKLFREFLKKFYKAWEYPENHLPVKVAFKKDKVDGAYLKVDFNDEWYHIKGPTNWY